MIQRVHAIPESIVRSHLQALEISTWLTEYFRQEHEPMATEVAPRRVIEVLNEAGVKPVLMGTHGLVAWRSESRATQDVDVLVRKKDIRKAIRALQGAYPQLTITDFPVVTRFTDPETQKVVLDVMKPTQPIFRIVFRHTIPIGDTHEIPELEMALIAKFAAMVSPNRKEAKKFVDAGDFIDVVDHNRDDLDLRKLKRLADKVYPGGSTEIMEMVENILAGRPIHL
jgi:hypothetical protein